MPKGKYIRTKPVSEETRLHMSISQRKSQMGHIVSEETRRKIRAVHCGKSLSNEHKRKLSAALLGRIVSEETKKKMSVAQTGRNILNFKGKRHTEETKKKMSVAATGRSSSEKTKQKLRDVNIGKRRADEGIIKQVESRIGGFWYGNVRYNTNPQYCEKWTPDLKERCRAYFDYTCFICRVKQISPKLNVHHIHYDKQMCCNGSPQDIIPLCKSCHTKTNYIRDRWENELTDKLYNLYPDGKCFFTKKEMKEFRHCQYASAMLRQ